MVSLKEAIVSELKQPFTIHELDEWVESYIKELEQHMRKLVVDEDENGFVLVKLDEVLRFLRGETK